jgi:hypothetical protein
VPDNDWKTILRGVLLRDAIWQCTSNTLSKPTSNIAAHRMAMDKPMIRSFCANENGKKKNGSSVLELRECL